MHIQCFMLSMKLIKKMIVNNKIKSGFSNKALPLFCLHILGYLYKDWGCHTTSSWFGIQGSCEDLVLNIY